MTRSRLERERLSLLVAHQIELWIDQTGRAPGETIGTTRSLADRYEASHGVIAGALDRLERRGIIERQRGVGIVLCAVPTDSAYRLSGAAYRIERPSPAELVETRFLIEEQTATAAARASTREVAAGLQKLAEADGVSGDAAFHEAIAQTAGNQILLAMLRGILALVAEFAPVDQSPALALSDHRAIADAIERHDAPAAHMAMRVHLLRERRALEQAGLLAPRRR